jgi:hypothetical protein
MNGRYKDWDPVEKKASTGSASVNRPGYESEGLWCKNDNPKQYQATTQKGCGMNSLV